MRGLTIINLILTVLLSTTNPTYEQEFGYYSETMVVVNVDYETDIVTVMDFDGTLWEYEECEDWYEGDLVSMIMCDNGTDASYDDIIIDLKYEGWVTSWGWDGDKPLVVFDYE